MPLMECVACGHVQTQGGSKFAFCEDCGSSQLRRATEGFEQHL